MAISFLDISGIYLLVQPFCKEVFMIGISICTDTFKKVRLDWSVSKFIWTKFAMCASCVRNLFLQSTNKSGNLNRRNLGKSDVTVRQNPIVTL